MPRTILIHLNVELPDSTPEISAGAVQEAIEGALEVGLEGCDLHVEIRPVVALAEEI